MIILGRPGGSTAFDPIVRDPVMKAIHRELAGGECMLSGNYYIEKYGPCVGGATFVLRILY